MTLPEVDLLPGSLVIGDLHLDVGDQDSLEPFMDWLAALNGVPRLVILGDLFEYWVGPAQAKEPGAQALCAVILRLVQRGTAVDVVPGNRDFLLDENFERLTGARVRHDSLVGLTAGGTRVLFLHGDELCTKDTGHQRLRRVLRAPLTRWIAFHMPIAWANAVALRLRRASRENRGRKSAETVEMMPDACQRAAAAARSSVLVCGHAHRHQDRELDSGPRWMVVDDYGGPLDAVVVQEDDRLALIQSGWRRS